MPGFEFTPGGMTPIGSENGGNADIVPGGAFLGDLQAARQGAQPAQQSLPHPSLQAPAKPHGNRRNKSQIDAEQLKPGDVIKLAKKRIRQLKRELKHHTKLEAELAELERLVAAAENPAAPVRAISTARSAS